MKRKLYSLLTGLGFVLMAQSVMAQVTFVLTQPPCNNDGILTASFNNPTPPLTVSWHLANGTTITHTGVTGTSDVLTGYSGIAVTVIASTSAGQGQDGIFQGAAPFSYQVATANAICPALGSATATVTGGTAPYTYQWLDASSTIVSTSNPASLPNGVYQIIITDANGCISGSFNNPYDSIFVHSEAAFNYTVSATAANCTNGTATVGSFTGTGMLPYTYLWSNGATSSSITGLTQGNYFVTVTDAQGCQRTKDKHVTQAVTINANATPTAATCIQNNGSIITFGSGGVTPYSYLYSNGANTQSATGLSSGLYNVTVTDANGCTGSTGVYVGSSTPVNVTYTSTSSACASPTGSATLNVTGGAAPYTITWSTFPAQTGVTANNLSAGTYYFHVVDANGCVRDGAVVVNPVTVINATLTATNAMCTQSNGSITVTPSGGAMPYTYSWSNPAASGNNPTNLPAGYYNVTITDANGCSVTKYRQIEASSPVHIGLASTPVSCLYSNDGSINATVWGGTAPYTYSWGSGQSTANITGLHTGAYYLYVTDANGCTADQSAYITNSQTSNSCYCTISGKVYNDANGNCILDAGETGIANIQMHCSGMGYTYTNSNGEYSFKVPSGTYSVSQTILASYPLAACQSNNISVTTVAASGCVQTVNFADAVTPLHDIHISLWHTNGAVPGNSHEQICVVSNQGTVPESTILAGLKTDGQIGAATFSPSGIFANPASNYYSTSGNTFPTLAPGGYQQFTLSYNVPTNIPLGTSVVFDDSAVYSGPMSTWVNDYSPWNNINHVTETIVSSYDPNFMQVNTQGQGIPGYISRNDSTLNYMVHFQNEGTYFAQNVVVIDTLSDKLDWKSLRPISSSHNASISIDENGVLKYTFSNIQLPAKMNDEAGSNGMFVYSIKLKPNLPYGTEIKNKAGIYFDYNEPVITNGVLNTLKEPTGITNPGNVNKLGFVIYPNPTKTSFTAMVDNKTANASTVITITDISGRTILSKEMVLQVGKQLIEMNTNSLIDGLYFVNLNVAGTKGTQKLVIVK
ncbi:T9SS type A sorting domain-containing protein [Taibaiella lutea]|uniref:T9SS type A sorting domain-containing protein n=1 Tax=Taibaiella lutea TaxID=2608001 RepID=A0A5M6CJ69_9BACT|nr:T9SS type A sorting domain-containing protein [Taibaiella lutea]KAA5534500.1 T9SS type A sorting domain-containing protein [Taibaiella lutea]